MSKTALSKEDFRRLVKERAAKKIESPFAKYDNAGQLNCTLCKVAVKSEAVWTAHVNGRQHLLLQNKSVAALKSPSPLAGNTTMKRPVSPSRSSDSVKKQKPSPVADSKQNLKHFESMEKEIMMEDLTLGKDGLPAGFFDGPEVTLSPPTEMLPPKAIPAQRSSHLPDNFFDKPNKNTQQKIERDKKAQEEEEWARFQKEIQEESHKSAVVVEMEDDEGRKQRELEELEEQMERWRKIVDLERKKEAAMAQVAVPAEVVEVTVTKEEEASDEEDDTDFEFLDWRKRKLW